MILTAEEHANPAPQPVEKPRLVVVKTLYHQQPGEDPTAIETRYVRALEDSEQVYKRTFLVGDEWVRLPSDWLASASCVSVENKEGRFTQVKPSAQEVEEAASRIVDVGVLVEDKSHWWLPIIVVRPTQSQDWEPVDLKGLYLRCRKGKARVLVTIFPQ